MGPHPYAHAERQHHQLAKAVWGDLPVRLCFQAYAAPQLTAGSSHLKPQHGFMEQVEIDFTPRADDGTLPRNSHLVQWADGLLDAMDGFDKPMRVNSELTKRALADAGFVDINEEIIKFALNGWPSDLREKEMGRWFNLGITKGLQAYSLAPLHWGQGKSLPEINQLLERVQEEIRSVNIHVYFTL